MASVFSQMPLLGLSFIVVVGRQTLPDHLYATLVAVVPQLSKILGELLYQLVDCFNTHSSKSGTLTLTCTGMHPRRMELCWCDLVCRFVFMNLALTLLLPPSSTPVTVLIYNLPRYGIALWEKGPYFRDWVPIGTFITFGSLFIVQGPCFRYLG